MIHMAFRYQRRCGTLSMTLQGHAGAAKKGEDLVCAGATTLAYTLGQAVQEMYQMGLLRRKPRVCLQEGWAEILATPRATALAEGLMAFWTVQAGAAVLGKSFPEYVQLEPLRIPLPVYEEEEA